jgi:titin
MRWFPLWNRRRGSNDDRGVTTVEYGLLAALVGIVAIGSLLALRSATESAFGASVEGPGVVKCLDPACSNAAAAVPAAVGISAPTPPGAPVLNSATPGTNSVALAWSAPTTGGAPENYSVVGSPLSSCTVTAPTLGCTIFGLTAGQQYTFRVVASNAIGTGATSNALTATPTAPATCASLSGALTLRNQTDNPVTVTITQSGVTGLVVTAVSAGNNADGTLTAISGTSQATWSHGTGSPNYSWTGTFSFTGSNCTGTATGVSLTLRTN